MLSTFTYPEFQSYCPPEIESGKPGEYTVVIVGAGPVGLCAAIDLAQQGKSVLLLDNDNTVSIGSRGVCYAKRTLEILDRLGCGEPMVQKGVSWNVGRTFFRNDEVFNFNLCPEPDHHRPGMINLQQYYLEDYLVKHALGLPKLDIRFMNKVTQVHSKEHSVDLAVETPFGNYQLNTQWLIVADGARSPMRSMLGLDIDGKVFMDRFLIADVIMKADFPTERWFWFDPPFHRNQSVLLHRQADNVFRIDFQLGWQADPDEEKKPENVIPRIQAMLGPEHEFELEWVSVYTFQCRRMNRFNHDRVLFAGDCAHQVSPFGARGANSGIQDTDNLVWKLNLVLDGKAPEQLLDTYSQERIYAADENIMNSTRSTDFITPKSRVSKMFRNAVLDLAERHNFARSLVNSGRLSVPSFLTQSVLNTPDEDSFTGRMVPGAPMDDAPVINAAGNHDWLLGHTGNTFAVLYYLNNLTDLSDKQRDQLRRALQELFIPVNIVFVARDTQDARDALKLCKEHCVLDSNNRIAERYDMKPHTLYLVRPDQHIAARWRELHMQKLLQALQKASGNVPLHTQSINQD